MCGGDGSWTPDPTTLMCEGKIYLTLLSLLAGQMVIIVHCNITSSVNCRIPRHPGNGSIINYTSSVEGPALLYQCNPGFGPVGEMTAVCAANGRWIPDPANVTCREIGLYGTYNRRCN